jgi:hypothetical protein
MFLLLIIVSSACGMVFSLNFTSSIIESQTLASHMLLFWVPSKLGKIGPTYDCKYTSLDILL